MPSQVGYRLRFLVGTPAIDTLRDSHAHIVHSYLYAFGNDDTPFGMGIEAFVLETCEGFVAGPLGLNLRFRAFSSRAFEIDFMGGADLSTLSLTELKN